MLLDPRPALPRPAFVGTSLYFACAAAPSGLGGCSLLVLPVRVAAHPRVGCAPMFLAEDRQWLDPKPVQLLPMKDLAETVAALKDGRADAGALTLDEVLRARAEGLSSTVVLDFDVSLGTDKLLAKPGIASLKQLKGARLGFEAGSVADIVLAEALRLGGLVRQDMLLSQVAVGEQVAAWQAHELDAVISYEFESNPQDAAYRLAPHIGRPPAAVLAAFKGMLLPSLANNHELLSGPTLMLALAQQVLQTLQGADLVTTQQDALVDLFDASYLPSSGLLQ